MIYRWHSLCEPHSDFRMFWPGCSKIHPLIWKAFLFKAMICNGWYHSDKLKSSKAVSVKRLNKIAYPLTTTSVLRKITSYMYIWCSVSTLFVFPCTLLVLWSCNSTIPCKCNTFSKLTLSIQLNSIWRTLGWIADLDFQKKVVSANFP